MEPEEFPCELVEWGAAARMAAALGFAMKSSEYGPDVVIAIGRGGYVPARVVADVLVHEMLTSIRVAHWGVAAVERDRAEVTIPLALDISGQRVLVVDDVTDTGETLAVTGEYLQGRGPAEVRTAVLQHKASSAVVPDYYVEYITDWRWIIYPWAVREDLAGFIRAILGDGPADRHGIRDALSRRYGLSPDRDRIDEVLGMMAGMGWAQEEAGRFVLPPGA